MTAPKLSHHMVTLTAIGDTYEEATRSFRETYPGIRWNGLHRDGPDSYYTASARVRVDHDALLAAIRATREKKARAAKGRKS